MSTPNVKELKETVIKIQNIIKVMDKKKITGQNKREEYFWTNHGDMMKRYPFLISHMCSGNNMNILNTMFRHLEEIEQGEITQHDADVIVGQKLANEYLPHDEDL